MAFDTPSNPRLPLPPLASTFAGDPEMVELIEFFTAELVNRIRALEEAWVNRDVETLCRLTHQLKGAAAGYGYPSITEDAASYEAALKTVDPQTLSSLERMHAGFVAMLDRARAGAATPRRDAA